jgi:hypothetical protein
MAEKQNGQAGFAALGTETLGTWAELNQRVVQDLTRVSLGALEESARTTSEVQQATIAAWQNMQNAAARWQALWPEAFRDPVRWYQRACEQGTTALREMIDLGRRNAETAMHSFDRMQTHSDEAVRTIEETFREGASKIRDIQNRTETLRVA